MSAGEYCNRDVIVIEKAEPVREAINLMRSNHVGDVVVVEKKAGMVIALGILTDRDIVVELLAEDVDLDKVNVGDCDELSTCKCHGRSQTAGCYKIDAPQRRASIACTE